MIRSSPFLRPGRGLRLALVAAIVVWGGAGVVGTGALMRYKQTPGAKANVPTRWPSATHVLLDPDRPTLVMVAHPKCACTRASIGELSRLMTRLQGRVVAKVLMVRPNGVGNEWDQTDLVKSAASIPGVDVVVDIGGEEAHRFGALTSGQTYLYSPSGDLLFSGGITASRGHYGDNAGSLLIADLVMPNGMPQSASTSPPSSSATSTGPSKASSTPVFGCDVLDPGDPRATAQAALQPR